MTGALRSIRARLLAGLLALVAVTTIGVGTITYHQLLAQTSALLDYQLRQMALSLRNQTAFGSGPLILAPPPSGSDFIIQIWDPFGALRYDVSPPGLPVIRRAVLGYADVKLAGKPWRVYTQLTIDGVIQVAQPWSVRDELARQAAVPVLLPLLLLLLAMTAAVIWIVGRGLAPLQRLAAEVQRRDARSLEPIAAVDLAAETAPLIEELNRLLARLSEAFDKQRAFVADAAHELRSPLTALSLQLQLLDRARDDEARHEARVRLGRAIERAIHLASQLLTLARHEPQGAPAHLEPVALETCASQGIADVHALAEQRGIELSLAADPDVIVEGDPEALRILVRNLVDNAVRHSSPGGRVTVLIAAAGTLPAAAPPGARLTVEDEGPGIPAAERERAFDRFFRRSDAAEGGSGLGLAIVKAIADRHDARVRLEDAEPHGLRVVVTWPRLPAPAEPRPPDPPEPRPQEPVGRGAGPS